MSEKNSVELKVERLTAKVRAIVQRHLRKYFGSSPEEVRETQRALEHLTPAEIREAAKLYREKRK